MQISESRNSKPVCTTHLGNSGLKPLSQLGIAASCMKGLDNSDNSSNKHLLSPKSTQLVIG